MPVQGSMAAGGSGNSHNGSEMRRVLVEISGTALTSATGVAEETQSAIATRGGSVIDQVLDLHSPPEVIRCSTSGCDLRR